MVIWVNEQLDPGGLVHACLATCDEEIAKQCYENFQRNLTPAQRASGWQVRLRTVHAWEDVPVTAQKLC
ncbi:MAG: glycogen debranching protein [Gloeomargarita sp. SKYBB_i_bin120]|nr:glycogen debranching protein [Gloeomargarita sp. SKYG98]MCS7292516.1 glycogen debranching protein [Gloeomargarita sp. SKYB120]MDW8178077.1 glycogen debranching protein [Gloeomargarita sp. SKYBB_i_bin120]